MKTITIIGIRGYNVIYSGFETFVKWVIKKSDKKKFYYYLFCRKSYQIDKKKDKNYSLVLIPIIKNKYLETPIYSFFSNLITLFKKTDIILYLGLVHTPFIFIQKLLNRKTIINVDGLDWQRKRWNFLGRVYLKLCEQLTILFSDIIVCDSQIIFQYFKNKYSPKHIVYIPYGAEVNIRKPGKILKRFNLQPKKYIHCVGRLTPENRIEELIIAFKNIKTDYKCVIVGDSVYEDNYKQYLLKLADEDKRFVFTGFLQGKEYEEVCSNSALYIETKEIGGTHPSLLEAIAFGNPIIAKNVNYHQEVLKESSLYYANLNDLTIKIKKILNNKISFRQKNLSLKEKINTQYSWTLIIKKYEELFDKA